MANHVGVLPEYLLHAFSGQLSQAYGNGESSQCKDLRFMRLPHPRTGVPSLFLPYEDIASGKSVLLEVQAVSPPNRRSWFIAEEVFEDGKLLVMTSIDPAFLLVPILRAIQPADGAGSFRPLDDIMDDAAAKLGDDSVEAAMRILPQDIALLSSMHCVQGAMRGICDSKDITNDITVYRYSSTQVQQYLRKKVARLSSQEVSELSRTVTRNFAKDGLLEDGKESLLTTARLRSACDLISQYLPRDILDELLSSYDFSQLDAYNKALKEEAMALSSANMNAVEARESRSGQAKDASGDKKRKAAKGSTGVEKLKKANVKGMAKLSSFFQKKES